MTATLTESHTDSLVTQKALWLLAAVALNALETAIPRLPFLPWLKPGFANIITVLWIIKFGCGDALLYTALRIWISGFYFGFSLFALSLSLCGGTLSTIAMSALWAALGKRGLIGTIGMAVTGALFHNAGQLAAVYFTMSRNASLFAQIPFMLGASIVFGGIVGGIAPAAARILRFADDPPSHGENAHSNTGSRICRAAARTDKFAVTITCAACAALMFIDSAAVLTGAAILFSLTSSAITKKPVTVLYPIRFYALFLFIAITHLLLSPYGTRSEWLPFATEEGLLTFTKQSMRLWCWLQTIHIFKRFNFHTIFMSILYRFFPNRTDTLEAGMIALQHFPEIARAARSEKKSSAVSMLLHPKTALMNYMDNMTRRITQIVGKEYERQKILDF